MPVSETIVSTTRSQVAPEPAARGEQDLGAALESELVPCRLRGASGGDRGRDLLGAEIRNRRDDLAGCGVLDLDLRSDDGHRSEVLRLAAAAALLGRQPTAHSLSRQSRETLPMRTILVSDLHLGARSGADLVRRPEFAELLTGAIEGADQVVLLGDVLELRDRPLAEVVDIAAPFFEALGEAVGDGRIVVVPGNHDHQLLAPWLERRRLRGAGPLGLEQVAKANAGRWVRLRAERVMQTWSWRTRGSGSGTTYTRPMGTIWTYT